jgi:hypothetical protein
LSGAVGPILAQNAGAGRLDRVRETTSHCRQSLKRAQARASDS